ncbi:Mycosubtilin synthase subunit C [Orchesella cincta]|uniref:Mycosubtilin synthase subunit C n=1 Tax=Orchesella cincta TaxID=48709 RepID=A0A1D2MAT5_ORCCI|nr:Mycosubtilin synthase subunit C [Orchesella cincta]
MEYSNQGKSALQGPTKKFPSTTVIQYFQLGLTNGRIEPNNLAVVDGEKQLTFQQLDDISTKIANVISEAVRDTSNHNPDGDCVIGVCIEPSDRLIAILFGILKAGAAYVPFDISFPKNRIGKMVSDCRPLLVICDGKRNILAKFDSVTNLTKVLRTDELYKKMETIESNEANDGNKGENETAIVMYTSGSSGEPKGVRLSHKATLNRLEWQWDKFPFAPSEKCVFKTALTFGDAIAEIFGPLLQGFPVIVFDKTVASQPPLLMQKLHAYDITRVVVVPSMLKAIFQTIEIVGKDEGRKLLSSVRLWVCSGEALSYNLLKEFFENFPENFTLCNFYGSTELTADVTFVSFTTLQDVELKVLEKKHVEQGQTGEVFVAGCNLAKGYVGISDSDKFLDNPFDKASGVILFLDFAKLFRTGDFGSLALLPNGEPAIMYAGRMDSQIKVRAQRVDLSEIELAISGLESVSKVKVLCHHPGESDQTIIAYIVINPSHATVDKLTQEINEILREHERPVIRFLDEIPLLPVNGKTDRQRLLNLFAAEQETREEFDDWSSLAISEEELPIAKSLFNIISAVTLTSFHTIAENLDDSFFNIGGSSLNAVVVIVKLRDIGYFISIPDFTSAQTIREILSRISPKEIEPGTENQENKEYSVSPLTEKDKNDAVHIISYSFARKGDLEAYVNVPYKDFAYMIKSIWQSIVEKQLSFIVRSAINGEPVGVGLNFDIFDEPVQWKSKSFGKSMKLQFAPKMAYKMGSKIAYNSLKLGVVESQQKSMLPQGKGKLLHTFMLGVSENVDDSEKVLLIELMEEQNLLIAKENKFEGVFTTNSNPLTQQIGRDLHGYETLNEYQVNKYVAPDGAKPFELAPDSFKIICCWKNLITAL